MRGARTVVAVIVLVSGAVTGACGFSARAQTDGGPHDTDLHDAHDAAEPDALPDAPEGVTCFGSLGLDHACYPNSKIPAGMHPVNGMVTIDTGMSATCNGNANLTAAVPGNPCIIAYDSITFTSATVTITGPHPVIFLATGTGGITVDQNSTLDASSVAPHVGPGALAACNGATEPTGKGGGYGGSYTELGGQGGVGQGDQSSAKGLPATVLGQPAQLHGGCPGSVGSGSDQTAVPKGGGAVALVGGTITIEGLVVAGGDAGIASQTNAGNNSGGNGGAAGGMIVIDAPAIVGSGELAAKGGGGAQGRGGNLPASGTPGYYPINRAFESAGGNSGGSSGGPGGAGGPRFVNIAILNSGADGRDGTNAGGGGGGGAAGVVIATSTLPLTLSSEPAPQ